MSSVRAARGANPTQDYRVLLTILESIAWDINELLDTDAVLKRIVSSVVEYTPWTICWAGLFDSEEARVVIQYDSGLWNDLARPEDWNISGSPSLEALRQGAPLAIENIQEDDRFPLVRADAVQRGYRNVLITPLRTGGVRGALWLCGPTACVHTEAEVAFARVVGALTAIALENVQLVENERQLRVEREVELVEMRDLKDIAERQNSALSTLATAHERLLRGVVDAGGFSALARIISSLVELPVLLIDQFGDAIASARGVHTRNIAGLAEALRQRSLPVMRGLDAMRAGTVSFEGQSFTALPVVLDGVNFGHLCVEHGDGEIGQLELRVLDQAALAVALEFLKERIKITAELAGERDFGQLLAGGRAKDSHLRNRAARLGLNLDEPNRVLRVRLSFSSGTPSDASQIAILIQRRLRVLDVSIRVLPLTDGDLVVLVADRDEATGARVEQLVDRLRNIVREGCVFSFGCKPEGVMVGISNVAVGPEYLQESFVQATRCLEVMEAHGEVDGSLSIDDAGSYTLLVELDRERQQAFARRVLGTLEEYDQVHQAELLRTLDVFLDEFGSVSKTSEILYLHQTTVRYRLGRIEELSGYSLDDPEDRLRLQLALRLRRITQ